MAGAAPMVFAFFANPSPTTNPPRPAKLASLSFYPWIDI
jgi:hypothetical protein